MEEKIKNLMEKLEISREEALELMEEDKKIDKMTSTKEIESDLTAEQKAVAKKSRSTSTGQKAPREKKTKEENPSKTLLVEEMIKALENCGAVDFEIENKERIFSFTFNGTKYKITMSQPRK